jgi:hypothetical protein
VEGTLSLARVLRARVAHEHQATRGVRHKLVDDTVLLAQRVQHCIVYLTRNIFEDNPR